jgi:hypothetical protein
MLFFRTSALVCAATILLSTAGCGTTVSSTTTGTTATLTPTATSKAPIHGLLSMGQTPFATNPALTPDNSMTDATANPNVYVAGVIVVTWKQLQPNSGATLDVSAIELGLTALAAYNTAHPAHPMTGKLRVFAGLNAPAWAMNLDGAAVSTIVNGTGYSIPRFWTANYQLAWQSLQKQLAAVYDTDARLQEVAVSGCSSTTAEPFIAPLDPTTLSLLHAAGFSDAAYQGCLQNMPTMYSAWTVTPLDYTFNQFTNTDTGGQVANPGFTLQVMASWRATYGTARGIIANHGLQNPLSNGALPVYGEFTALGGPIEMQTISPTVDWNAAIALAITYHPTEIEIWQTTQAGGQAVISLAQLQLWSSEF